MKKRILLAMLIAFVYQAGTAQSNSLNDHEKFRAVMKENLLLLDTATHPRSYQALANNFERVAVTGKTFWQPYYYAALCYAVMSMAVKEKDKIDLLATRAESMLEKANSISPANSEIAALQAMIINAKILADPMSRWKDYSIQSAELLKRAKEQDPSNPRPFLIEAKTKLFTPVALGGGADAARPVIAEALKRFKHFKPLDELAPGWGQVQAEKLWESVNK